MTWLLLSVAYATLALLSWDVKRRGGNWRVRFAGLGMMVVITAVNIVGHQREDRAVIPALEAPAFNIAPVLFAGERPALIVEPAALSVEVYVSSVSDAGLYHRAGCRYEKQMSDKYRMTFESAAAAEQAGYAACGHCCD